MMSAEMTVEEDWRRAESFSDMPACRVLAVMVMMAAVCPGGSTSSVETGCANRHFMYSSLIAAEILMLHIRNPIYDGHCVVRIYTRDHSGEQRNSLFCKGVSTHICYIIKDESNEEQTDEVYTWDNSVLHSALRDPRHLRAGTDGVLEHVIRRGGICAKVSGKGAHHTAYDIVNNFL
jgi:hypothetical protein